MIKLLTGEELYLRDYFINQILEKQDYAMMNCTRHEAFGQAEMNLYYQVPLFNDKRIMLVFTEDISKNKFLDTILKEPSECTDLYIISSTLDKRCSFYKYCQKNNAIEEFKKLDDKSFRTYVQREIKKENRMIKEDTFNALLSRINYHNRPNCTLYTVSTYIKQCACCDEQIITMQSLDLIDKCIDEKSFDLAGHLFELEFDELYALTDELLAEKEEPIMILSLLLYNFRISYKLSLLSSSDNAATCLGVNPYQLRSIKKLPGNIAQKCMTIIQNNVNLIKTGANGAYILKMCLSRLAFTLQN